MTRNAMPLSNKLFTGLLSLTLTLCLGLLTLTSAHATQTVTYYHSNALGSPVAATDEAGNVLWREAYEPYGLRLIKDANSSGNNRYFTGHPEDSSTGLTYMGSRFYDPRVGRFLSPDPQRFRETSLASFNRYAYGNHNPYKYVDPDGEVPVLPIIYAVGKELVGMAVEHFTGVPASTKGILKAGAKKVVAKGVAKNPGDSVKLNKQLASQQQLGEKGVPVAGAGTKTELRDSKRLANEYGGNTSDWTKRSSSQHTAPDGRKFETHWYENPTTGQRVEPKTIVEDYLKGPK